MSIRHIALLGAFALLAPTSQAAAQGACQVQGTIAEIGQQPPSMRIAEEAREGETRYFEIEERSVPGWKKFEVGQEVEGACEDNGESPPRIIRLREKKPNRRR